ncbi:MAG: hypothetical protein J7518_10965 [Nocardioidaceae bacterium]|nr:hypothetical protein [Nocardioidaceae bacterium]
MSISLAVVGAVIVTAGVALVVHGSSSENLEIVAHDKSWLGYLPADAVDLEVAGLAEESVGGSRVRLVDVLDRTQTRFHRGGGSAEGLRLCFGGSVERALQVCVGAVPLGRIDRDVDLPWVVRVGDAHGVDWRARLSRRAPTLADVEYLKK